MTPAIELPAPITPQDVKESLHPSGYRLLIQILPPPGGDEKKWKDLLFTPEETREREWGAQIWGKVLDLGADAYKDEKRFPSGPWCHPEDVVLMRAYSGTRFRIGDHIYALINDDTVQAVTNEETAEKIERV